MLFCFFVLQDFSGDESKAVGSCSGTTAVLEEHGATAYDGNNPYGLTPAHSYAETEHLQGSFQNVQHVGSVGIQHVPLDFTHQALDQLFAVRIESSPEPVVELCELDQLGEMGLARQPAIFSSDLNT